MTLVMSPSAAHPVVCLFCHHGLRDEGNSFIRHVGRSRDCRVRWLDWLDLLRSDAGGD